MVEVGLWGSRWRRAGDGGVVRRVGGDIGTRQGD